jgi:hypothetical protein
MTAVSIMRRARGKQNTAQFGRRGSAAFPQPRVRLEAERVPGGPVARAKTPDFAPASMPKLTQRPLLCASCCFPHASPVSRTSAGKQKTVPKDRSKPLISFRKSGAGEGIRTLDPNLGKVVLYP